ncbi:hypothetical protein G6W57_00920 [Streptomyces sp. CAI-121]|uniref:hypothetical protein n=1 Tax=unclassified Streptomyces TaxID=2593676 RepID=UPI001587CBF5|nr:MULTISPECIES: hypothetical protein [unclassified Streptomyces]NUV65677.1 hypothetical protein [Streptomyces sp. CAI-121]NUW12414.1 hypothetical protein [Streptomyces sp. CAI-68]
MQLPEQPVAGQPDPVRRNADRIMAAVDEALLARQATSHRDETPLPAVGPTPPVPQPGQPPMSQWATDASGVLKAVSVASLPVGGALWIVGQVEPLTLGIILGSPAAAALAVARLVAKVKDANQAAPQPVTNNFYGTVHHDERTVTSTTRGVIANTRNHH